MLQREAGTGQRIALDVDQMLDPQSKFHVAAAVKTLARAALVGFELGKLRLPKAQDIGLDSAKFRHVANLEVEAVGDRGRVKGAFFGLLQSHSQGGGETAFWRRPRSRWIIGHSLHQL